MKNKILLITIILALSIIFSQILVACTSNIIIKIVYDNTKSIEVLEQRKNSKIKNIDDIDFCNVTFIKSAICPDQKIADAVYKYFYNDDQKPNGKYLYSKVDLNGDGRDEVFVFLFGRDFSGTGGNTAVILQDYKDEYKVIQKFTLVRNPIIISNTKTNGWNDIIMLVSGGGIEPSYNILKYGDKQYPSNPSLAPKLEDGTVVYGTGIISDELGRDVGFELK